MALGGGGSGANDIRAGGAYTELYTKDNTAAGLESAKRRLKEFSATAQAEMTKVTSATAGLKGAFDVADKSTGGFLGSFLKISAAAGAVKLALDHVASKYTEDLQRAIDKSTQLGAVARDMASRRQGLLLKDIDTTPGVQQPLDKLAGGLAGANDRAAALAGQLTRARNELDAARKADRFNLGGLVAPGLVDIPVDLGQDLGLAPDNVGRIKQAEAAVKDLEEAYKQAKDQAQELGDKQKDMVKAAKEERRIAGVNWAIYAADVMSQIEQVQKTGAEAKVILQRDFDRSLRDLRETARGTFTGAFGGNIGPGSLNFSLGGGNDTVLQELKMLRHLEEQKGDVDKKMADDIRDIKDREPEVFDAP